MKATILRHIYTDDRIYNKSDEKRIKDSYEKSDELTKSAINNIFVQLTGYSLETIINKED